MTSIAYTQTLTRSISLPTSSNRQIDCGLRGHGSLKAFSRIKYGPTVSRRSKAHGGRQTTVFGCTRLIPTAHLPSGSDDPRNPGHPLDADGTIYPPPSASRPRVIRQKSDVWRLSCIVATITCLRIRWQVRLGTRFSISWLRRV